jgi:hypothetical protein
MSGLTGGRGEWGRAMRHMAFLVALSTVPLGCGLGGGEGAGEGEREGEGRALSPGGEGGPAAVAPGPGDAPARQPGARPGSDPPVGAGGAHTEPGQSTVQGVVATFGSEPLVQVVLLREGAETVMLGRPDGVVDPVDDPNHPLAELARLVGATARVVGTTDAFDAGPMEGFGVTGYEILGIEGARPLAGRLVRGSAPEGTPDVLEPDGGGPLRILRGLPAEVPADRSRVWILGETRGDTLFVEGFGVLRGPPGG